MARRLPSLVGPDFSGDMERSSVTDENQETASRGDVNRFDAYLAVQEIPVLAASRELIFLVEGPK